MGFYRLRFAYKIVDENYKSCVLTYARTNHCMTNKKNWKLTGRRLKYPIGEIVISSNGVCNCSAECCIGIHAYKTLMEAREDLFYVSEKILKVYGNWWYPNGKKSTKIRAERVEVVEEVK